MKKVKHIMIDIETAATGHDALVLSVGVAGFMPYDKDPLSGNKSCYTCLMLHEQLLMGRRADPDTCRWWAKQSDEAIQAAWIPAAQSCVSELHSTLKEYFTTGEEIVWANGTDFDLTILESLFKDFGYKVPWRFTNKRCMRTLKEIKGVTKQPRRGTHHHALDDAEHQAIQVSEYLKHVNKIFL